MLILIHFLLYPALAFGLSLLLTWGAIHSLPRLGYIDQPGGRHIHKQAIPRGGGIAVILSFFVILGCYLLSAKNSEGHPLFLRLFLPSLPLLILGLIDDRRELKSWVKLLVQLLVVLIVWLMNQRTYVIGSWIAPWYFSLLMTAGWIIIVLNAFNLIDGLDGLASGLAIVSAGSLALWFLLAGNRHNEMMAMLILAGACLGFLRFNFYPAKIFLGDTGSTFLGLIFAITGLSTIDQAVTVTSLLLPVLAIGVPLFDVILAIWRRSIRRLLDPQSGGVMDGDQDHLHHRLLRRNEKQTTTAWILYLLALMFAGGALLLVLLRNTAPAVGYLILIIAIAIIIRWLATVELAVSLRLILHNFSNPRRGVLLNMAQPLFDLLSISISFFAACLLTQTVSDSILVVVFSIVPVFVCLLIGSNYKVYWLRAGLNDFGQLAWSIFLGSISAGVLLFFFCFLPMYFNASLSLYQFICGCIIFLSANLLLILSERFAVHYIGSFLFHQLALQTAAVPVKRTMIYGGGLRCKLYISSLYCTNERKEQIIGILNDDISLHGLRLYGFPVLGAWGDLNQIYHIHPFEKLLITPEKLPQSILELLLQFCDRNNIELTLFHFQEQVLSNCQFPLKNSTEFHEEEIIWPES